MKDSIEEFIEEHRSGFDQLEPKQASWQAVQRKTRKPTNYNWVWKVAAMLFLVTSLALIFERALVDDRDEVSESTPMNEELIQVETYYTGLISQKKAEIKLTIQEKSLTDVDLLADLDALDQMYVELKMDLEKNTNNEKLINAMVRNLQLRVEILNKQLEILQQLDKQKSDEIII